MNGVQIAAAIRHHFPQSRVIILATNAGDDQWLEAARIGASAVLPRFTTPDTLRNTVRAVLHGEEPLQTWLSDRGTDRLVSPVAAAETTALVHALTTRELAVLDTLLKGYSTKEMAAVLRIADQTVKNRLSSILRKLDLESRMAAVCLALKAGWGVPMMKGVWDDR